MDSFDDTCMANGEQADSCRKSEASPDQ